MASAATATGSDAPASVIEWADVFGVRLYQPCDMADDMLQFCIATARRSLAGVKEWQKDGDAAVSGMKEALDTKYGASWHIVAGKSYGSKIVHEARCFCCFYLGDLCVTMWR